MPNGWSYEIIVSDDMSDDGTAEYLKDIRVDTVKVILTQQRQGQYSRQNELFRVADGDYIVLLEADTLPIGTDYLQKLIEPFEANSKLGMTFGRAVNAKPRSVIEGILAFAWEYKYELYSRKFPESFYIFRGQSGRAFPKKIAKQIEFPSDAPEDTYSYLRVLELGYEVSHSQEARILYRNAKSLPDAMKQSNKFVASKSGLEKYFNYAILSKHFELHKKDLLAHSLRTLFKRPMKFVGYILLFLILKVMSINKKEFNPFLGIAKSSKDLRQIDRKNTHEYFSAIAKDYLSIAFKSSVGLDWLGKWEQEVLMAALGGDETLKVVDLGVGSGRNTELILNLGKKVVGLDFSEEMLRHTEQRLSERVMRKELELKKANLNQKLDFSEAEFDAAICVRVIKYVTTWPELVKEVHRIVRPGGVFVVDIANMYSVQYFSQFLDSYKTFNPARFRHVLKSAGFEINKEEYGQKMPFLCYKFAKYSWQLKILRKIESSLNRILAGFGSRSIMYVCVRN